jgi:hypothetical protein
MNKKFYDICKRSCRFYKPLRKTAEHCYGFDKVVKLIKDGKIETNKILSIDFKQFKNTNNLFLNEHLCKYCPFLKDGCDFRAGKGDEPCGGYKIFDILLSEDIDNKKFFEEND